MRVTKLLSVQVALSNTRALRSSQIARMVSMHREFRSRWNFLATVAVEAGHQSAKCRVGWG
jgi:hypothetical protein